MRYYSREAKFQRPASNPQLTQLPKVNSRSQTSFSTNQENNLKNNKMGWLYKIAVYSSLVQLRTVEQRISRWISFGIAVWISFAASSTADAVDQGLKYFG